MVGMATATAATTVIQKSSDDDVVMHPYALLRWAYLTLRLAKHGDGSRSGDGSYLATMRIAARTVRGTEARPPSIVRTILSLVSASVGSPPPVFPISKGRVIHLSARRSYSISTRFLDTSTTSFFPACMDKLPLGLKNAARADAKATTRMTTSATLALAVMSHCTRERAWFHRWELRISKREVEGEESRGRWREERWRRGF
ncbi:hypothetical protein SCHPADRAFT_658801 [Schizopora paradoxa]|uniref:Uncharacterized protein n=1 Tax=Schizopora paradoxa TaxID=27342 RepID=A0A0H2R5Y7_9AGAM|nr:hypothetical protein SCHPADRAFT_658801 [Schizopora paradoxa]